MDNDISIQNLKNQFFNDFSILLVSIESISSKDDYNNVTFNISKLFSKYKDIIVYTEIKDCITNISEKILQLGYISGYFE